MRHAAPCADCPAPAGKLRELAAADAAALVQPRSPLLDLGNVMPGSSSLKKRQNPAEQSQPV